MCTIRAEPVGFPSLRKKAMEQIKRPWWWLWGQDKHETSWLSFITLKKKNQWMVTAVRSPTVCQTLGCSRPLAARPIKSLWWCLFYRWENWGTEGMVGTHKVTQLVRGRDRAPNSLSVIASACIREDGTWTFRHRWDGRKWNGGGGLFRISEEEEAAGH